MSQLNPTLAEPKSALLDPGILGNARVQGGLLTALTSGRLAHAHLFTGPHGIGKRLIALALSKALVCANRNALGAPCLTCRSCSMVDQGVHPDVRVFERDKTTYSTDLMREVILDWASRRPREGRHKIGILNDVQHLGMQSANAFLKTLEEPPQGTVWVLLTSDPAATISTIRSRCQITAFQPLANDEMEQLMQGKLGTDLRAAATEAASRTGKRGSGAAKAASARSPGSAAKKSKAKGGFSGFTRDDDEHDQEAFDDSDDQAPDPLTSHQQAFALAFAQGSPGAAIASVREGYLEVRNLLFSRMAAAAKSAAKAVESQRGVGALGRPGTSAAKPVGWSNASSSTDIGPIDAGEQLLVLLNREEEPTQEGLRQRLAISIGIAEGLLRDMLVLIAGAGVPSFNLDIARAIEGALSTAGGSISIASLQGGLERMAGIRRAVLGNASPKTAAATVMLELEGVFSS